PTLCPRDQPTEHDSGDADAMNDDIQNLRPEEWREKSGDGGNRLPRRNRGKKQGEGGTDQQQYEYADQAQIFLLLIGILLVRERHTESVRSGSLSFVFLTGDIKQPISARGMGC